MIRSSHGVIHEFTGAELREGQWLQGSRVVSTPTGPISKDLQYSIEKVIVDATNVVNRAQQRFIPSEVQELDVELLFFTARITARDALFGFPVGTAVRLQHPDGRWQVIDLDDNAAVTIDALPRGEYFIEVKGPGLSFVHPVALSRDQDVDLQVLTYLDISVALALGGIAVIGVLFVGRPYLFRRLRRRRHRAPVAHTPGEPA